VNRTAVVTTTISRSVDSFYGQIIDDLRERGYRVVVVTSSGPELPRLRTRADEVRIVEMARDVSLVKDLRALMGWIRVLVGVRPDLILGGTPKAGLLSMMAAWILRVPRRAYLLQGLRLESVRGPKRMVLAAMERVSSWCSQGVIAVSPSLAREYTRAGLNAGRAVHVPHHGSSHGVDSVHFAPQPRNDDLLRELGLDPALPVVIFIGRLTADKGPAALTEALRRLADQGEHVQLLVVGAQDEPDSQAHLERLVAASKRVRVLNHLDDVRPYLAASDLLILPTLREGLPNVVLEAAAMGIPSVTTTATGAVDAVVDGVTGLLVPPENGEELARAVRRLLDDADLRSHLGASARERVVRDFQPTDVARSIVDHALGSHAAPDTRAVATVPSRTFVVTGATGFVGSSLVPLLRARGHSVITVGRTGCDFDYDSLATAPVPEGACWVHLAGKAHDLRQVADEGDYHRVNVDLTLGVWDLAVDRSASSFVYVSSIKAVVDHAAVPVGEDTTALPQTPYGRSKLRAEQELTARAAAPGAPRLTILRPCLIYGPGVKGNLRLLQGLVKRRIPYPLGSFDNQRSVLSVRNLTHVIEQVGADNLPPGLYHVADDEAMSTVAMLRAIGVAMGRRPIVVAMPERMVRGAARAGTRARGPLTTERLEKLTESLVVDTRRLRSGLGAHQLPESSYDGFVAAFRAAD
jgi:glycosyltransferase involved in cell wall biosynthesis/nucleoside-diphosphate-sugar epimerase